MGGWNASVAASEAFPSGASLKFGELRLVNMKIISESTVSAPKLITRRLVKALVLSCVFFAVTDVRGDPLPTQTYSFSLVGAGPFTVTPVSATIVRDDQTFSFSSVMPFPLTSGFVQGFDNLTIPTFPDRFFNGTFGWSGRGEDGVFGSLTVQTSVFTDPVDPAHGDFFGSEDFTGTFQITGGTGRYLDATGGGPYVAHSEYRPATAPGTLFSGDTTVTGTGTVTVLVPEPSTLVLAGIGVILLAGMANRRRGRRAHGRRDRMRWDRDGKVT